MPDPEGVQEVDYWLETNEMIFSTWVPLEEEGDPRKIILFGMANKNNRACFFKMTVEAFGTNMSTFRYKIEAIFRLYSCYLKLFPLLFSEFLRCQPIFALTLLRQFVVVLSFPRPFVISSLPKMK